MPLPRLTRRDLLKLAGAAIAFPRFTLSAPASSATTPGSVTGDPLAAKHGEQVLRDGGNAIDAAITAAFAACICSPSKCGVGGYGGHAVIALAGGKKITAIDFDSTAPAAARPDMYPLGPNGRVVGNVNSTGWLAAGVPGTLAGLELALTRYGTRPLRDVLQPAIALAEQGVHAVPIKGIDDRAADASRNDPRPDSEQLAAANSPREKQRNAAELRLLRTLARRNTTDSFYRGDIAETVAAAFQRHGGLVTKADLAAYRARELPPLTLDFSADFQLHTAPLPASGALILQALHALKALDWVSLSASERLHAKLEALRIAWSDRLATWGDPDHVSVPVEKLLSPAHAAASAARIRIALTTPKPVPLAVEPARAGGTVNISAADRAGNLIAITLTHGGSYGARVAVDALGLVLGHGMSRFEPRPGRPNSVAPAKRPITNMCPTIVTQRGTPVFAVGAAGGTRIPNSVFEVLLQTVALRSPLDVALASPRLDTTGALALDLAKAHTAEDEALFLRLGYTVKRAASAYVSAATFDPTTRVTSASAR